MSGLRRMLPLFWIVYLLVNSEVTGVLSKACAFSKSSYNVFTNGYDRVLASEECLWGCCQNSSTPCCPVPISLVVGVILGGVLTVALVTALVCYCCVYRRNQLCVNGLLSVGHRRPAATTPTARRSVVYQAEARENNTESPHQRYSDAPPSYEDVMKGQINPTFKPDTGEGDRQHES